MLEKTDLDNAKKEMNILNNFYNYLRNYKDDDILSLMQDYCYEQDIPLEELGFLISEDKYLKDYVESCLIKNNYIKNNKEFKDDF